MKNAFFFIEKYKSTEKFSFYFDSVMLCLWIGVAIAVWSWSSLLFMSMASSILSNMHNRGRGNFYLAMISEYHGSLERPTPVDM